MRKRRLWYWLLLAAGVVFSVVSLLVVSRSFCVTAFVRYGISVPRCPDGEVRQTASVVANRLRRGSKGRVACGATAHFTTGPADQVLNAEVERSECRLSLVSGGQERPLAPAGAGWKREGGLHWAEIELPKDLRDGDYLLRAQVKTPLGESRAEAPLAVYAPARIHVLTDRPLYEPGNTVRFRAVVLRARDLAPLDGRPGAWIVTDPNGEVVLEEKAPAGDWGVVAGSFPLDRQAESGDWRVAWASGDARDEVSFRVEPFTLPRFRVEAAPDKPFYGRNATPMLRGSVQYSSGAPVSGAKVAIEWSSSGEWPLPTEWLEGGLPQSATSDPSGRFSLSLPRIPGDLRGRVTLAAAISATDLAGEVVRGAANVLLSEEPIQVAAVSELGDGLVAGFNNRLFLRVTDAAGAPLAGAALQIKRAWDPLDPGVEATADEDAVAELQIDPGPPSNIVIPPMPVRPPPPEPVVSMGSVSEAISQREPSLAETRAIEGWIAGLEPCARFGARSISLGLRVAASGQVLGVAAESLPLEQCVARKLQEKRFPPGTERVFHVSLDVGDSQLPGLTADVEGVPSVPSGLEALISEAASDARLCLPTRLSEAASLPRVAVWRARKGSTSVELSWINDPLSEPPRIDSPASSCIEGKLSRLELSEKADSDAVGFARLSAQPTGSDSIDAPQPTVMLGYELRVEASVAGESVGAARLILSPGLIPAVRLRANPVVAKAGGPLTIEIIRGPNFRGALPDKLQLKTADKTLEAKVDPKKREAVFALPADVEGWLSVDWAGAQARAWVSPQSSLSIAVRPEREHYTPGQEAKLLLTTSSGGKGTPAAVGLFGVDESLSQLIALAGPDELARLRPQVQVSSPAFGVLDAQALTMGRIRGAHASVATVLRVSSVPARAEIDNYFSTRADGGFDPLEMLTDSFYVALSELHAQTRAWEESAPKGEQMHPALMAKLWDRAIEACEKRGAPVRDAYGRKLRLSGLPSYLLALVEPRAVVVDGTRLPEDTESWSAWVAEELP